MQVAELTFGVGVAASGFKPALEHGGGARPFWPVTLSAIGGLDQGAQSATAEEALDRGGIFRPYDCDEFLPFMRFHGQVL